MNYTNFITEVKKGVEEICHDYAVVEIESIIKNNGNKHDAIIIRRADSNVSPTIYLEGFYSDLLDGKNIDEIVSEIVELDNRNQVKLGFSVEEFQDYSFICPRIICRLVNTGRNRELLEKIPHRSFYDLSIVYYCCLDSMEDRMATTLIYNSHIARWEITEEELYEAAMCNGPVISPAMIVNLRDMLLSLMSSGYPFDEQNRELMEELRDEPTMDMYVLTNENRLFGAAALLYEELLEDFASEHGSFYILPSSIHEVILVPDNDRITVDALLNMVKDTNSSAVEDEEVLSDNVYYYDTFKRTVKMFNNINPLRDYSLDN